MKLTARLLFGVMLVGCSGGEDATGQTTDVTDLSDAQKAAVLFQLEVHGIKSTSARFKADKVVVGGDLEFPIDYLLGLSEQSKEKGYATGQIAFVNMNTHNIKLAFSPLQPTENWKAAARKAAQHWSDATWDGQGIDLDIDEANTGKTITVGATNISGWPLFYSTCTYAIATFPSGFPDGSPGNITINTGFNCGGCPTSSNLPEGVMNTVMRHEMGHALGMVHPEDSNAKDVIHISNTATGTAYSTVMHESISCSGYTLLQPDDRESAFMVFGADP